MVSNLLSHSIFGLTLSSGLQNKVIIEPPPTQVNGCFGSTNKLFPFSKNVSRCYAYFIVTRDFGDLTENTDMSVTFSLYRFEIQFKNHVFYSAEYAKFIIITKPHLWEILVFWFQWKKSASEVHKKFIEVYRESAPTHKSCRDWFCRFKNGDLCVKDKPRRGQPKKSKTKCCRH